MNTIEKTRKRHTQAEIAELLAAYQHRDTALTQKEWCENQQISANTLRLWLLKEKETNQVLNWASVTVINETAKTSPLVLQIGKCNITISQSNDLKLLRDVVEMVMQIC